MLTEFYGVEEGFPLATHLITRSADAAWPKRLNFVSDALLALLLADEREQLKITSTGLKVFERHELKGGAYIGKCHYRLAQVSDRCRGWCVDIEVEGGCAYSLMHGCLMEGLPAQTGECMQATQACMEVYACTGHGAAVDGE